MANLLRIDTKGDLQQLEPVKFTNETDDLQRYVAKNPAIIGDNVVIIAQQLDTGTGKRLDMLALERVAENQVRPIVVELKNTDAGTDALLQVLKYADWVLGHIDSVKYHAEKMGVKYKDLDNTSVKVSIIAPNIGIDLVELGGYIGKNIDFEFVQFERFQDHQGELLLIERKIPSTTPISITTVQEEWNWERFEKELKINKDRLKIGKHLYNSLLKLNDEYDWGIIPIFRKYYIPFKKAGWNILEIDLYSKHCRLAIQLPKAPEELDIPKIYPDLEQEYSSDYHRYYFIITDGNLDLSDFVEYIGKALEELGL
jgi:hypothetical protein